MVPHIKINSPMYYMIFDVTRDLIVSVITECSKHQNDSPQIQEYLRKVLSKAVYDRQHMTSGFNETQELHTEYEKIYQDLKDVLQEASGDTK